MYTKRFWTDVETTGLYPQKHFAFQMSYLIEEDGRVLHSRTLEMRPDRHGDYEFSGKAEAVHGFTREKIISFQPESEAVDLLVGDLEQYGKGRLTFAGYNVNFDAGFVKAMFYRLGRGNEFYRHFDRMNFDVMQFVQAGRVAGIVPLPHIDLESVCKYFGINTEGAHHSMTDILNTKAVFDSLSHLFAQVRPLAVENSLT